MITFRNLAIVTTAAMSLALAQLPASAEEILYGTSGAGNMGNTASSLYTIDPATGASELVGEIGFNHVVSIDFDPFTEVLYGISNAARGENNNTLITIDTNTGEGTFVVGIAATFQSPDMAFDSARATTNNPVQHINASDRNTSVSPTSMKITPVIIGFRT